MDHSYRLNNQQVRNTDSLRLAIINSHALLLPLRPQKGWDASVVKAYTEAKEFSKNARKNWLHGLRRSWGILLSRMSVLVRAGVLPPKVILDPSLPIFPKNVNGWVPSGPLDSFESQLRRILQKEPSRIWFAKSRSSHPFHSLNDALQDASRDRELFGGSSEEYDSDDSTNAGENSAHANITPTQLAFGGDVEATPGDDSFENASLQVVPEIDVETATENVSLETILSEEAHLEGSVESSESSVADTEEFEIDGRGIDDAIVL